VAVWLWFARHSVFVGRAVLFGIAVMKTKFWNEGSGCFYEVLGRKIVPRRLSCADDAYCKYRYTCCVCSSFSWWYSISVLFAALGLSGVVPAIHSVVKFGLLESFTVGQLGWLSLMAVLYLTGKRKSLWCFLCSENELSSSLCWS